MRYFRDNTGTSLIELLMTIAIFAMISISLYSLIWIGIHLVRDNEARLDALGIAQTKIEEIRNAPYESIGTNGGIPDGDFLQKEIIERNNRTFTIETDIRYIDDPFDGVAPTDTVSNDYKKIRVAVTWEGQYVAKPLLLITNVSPEGIETNEGGGTLWIEVFNAAAEPLPGTTVTVTNTNTTPAITITSSTDTNGRFILPGAPASVQSYHVEVSKTNYSSGQTYEENTVENPNPDPQDLSVLEGKITTQNFIIDLLSSLTITTERLDDTTPISGLDITLTGAKRIGTDLSEKDIPKYNESFTTDTDGRITVTNMEFDTYSLTLDPISGYDIAGYSAPLPYLLQPNTTETLTLQLADDEAFTLLVNVKNSAGEPIEGATVHLYNDSLTIDSTVVSTAFGQSFHSPLLAQELILDITATGYAPSTSTVTILGDDEITISLLESTP